MIVENGTGILKTVFAQTAAVHQRGSRDKEKAEKVLTTVPSLLCYSWA